MNITKTFLGWSAEDDAFYKYPDRVLFNPKGTSADSNPSGTIRINFTEKFVEALKLGFELGDKDPSVLEGVRSFYRSTIAHEATHAYQYHTNPVRDFSRMPEAIRDGLADPDILKDALRKVEYEHDAIGVGRQYLRKDPLLALGHAIDKYEEDNPQKFREGGPYFLLARFRKNAFVQRYIYEDVDFISFGREFSDSDDIIYNGEVVPAQVVVRLNKINNQLTNEPTKKESLEALKQEINQLQINWDKYMTGKSLALLSEAFPYTTDIERQFRILSAQVKAKIK